MSKNSLVSRLTIRSSRVRFAASSRCGKLVHLAAAATLLGLAQALGLTKGEVVSNNIESQLQTIETRLGETLESFVVARKINEECDKDHDQILHAIINKRGGFWQASLLAHQTTQFVGINALLDEHSNDSATLYSALKDLEALHPGVLPSNLKQTLDTIRNKYKKFRHKLFGHNDKERDQVVSQFNEAGFTWQSLASDLEELEYIFKVLFLAMRERPIPSREEANRMQFPYSKSVERAANDTRMLLTDLRA